MQRSSGSTEDLAALMIQRHTRGYLQRSRWASELWYFIFGDNDFSLRTYIGMHYGLSYRKPPPDPRPRAATTIQRIVRGSRTRVDFRNQLYQNKAATTIQRIVRGSRIRAHLTSQLYEYLGGNTVEPLRVDSRDHAKNAIALNIPRLLVRLYSYVIARFKYLQTRAQSQDRDDFQLSLFYISLRMFNSAITEYLTGKRTT